jgi:SOS-response transcriptional repressor LexA
MAFDDLNNRVYIAICDYLVRYGYPPNYEELGAACQLPVDDVLRHLTRLVIRGYIEFREDRPRSIRFVFFPAA